MKKKRWEVTEWLRCKVIKREEGRGGDISIKKKCRSRSRRESVYVYVCVCVCRWHSTCT